MKVKTLFSAVTLLLGFAGCHLDFKNTCEDVWIVTNNSDKPVTVNFDTKAQEIPAKSSKKIYNYPYDAEISIDDSFKVKFTESYNYSESKARRTLIITDEPSEESV